MTAYTTAKEFVTQEMEELLATVHDMSNKFKDINNSDVPRMTIFLSDMIRVLALKKFKFGLVLKECEAYDKNEVSVQLVDDDTKEELFKSADNEKELMDYWYKREVELRTQGHEAEAKDADKTYYGCMRAFTATRVIFCKLGIDEEYEITRAL